ncbi:hypothetical protein Nepgr_033094 [Nepenthes gracilis]|uniref:Uncharacterized protein n=1 Tax=Nepenthes gracilis TaxID=150966 RepID=A0AAD3TLH0_NEPGR|nr:hypothetical protein Nepgr_033094 [Nepenthes gracilis]
MGNEAPPQMVLVHRNEARWGGAGSIQCVRSTETPFARKAIVDHERSNVPSSQDGFGVVNTMTRGPGSMGRRRDFSLYRHLSLKNHKNVQRKYRQKKGYDPRSV